MRERHAIGEEPERGERERRLPAKFDGPLVPSTDSTFAVWSGVESVLV